MGAARLEIVPDTIHYEIGTKFVLRARLSNSLGQLLPVADAASTIWTSLRTEVQLSTPGATSDVVVTVDPGGDIVITAAVAGVSATAVLRASGVQSGTTDWIAVHAVQSDPPMLAYVDGLGAMGTSDSLIAFVGSGPLDAFGAGKAGNLTLFSRSRQTVHANPTWGDDCDVLTDTANPPAACTHTPLTLVAAATVDVKVWVLADGSNFPDVARAGIDDARSALRQAWTGIELRDVGVSVRPSIDVILDVSSSNNWTCPSAGAFDIRSQLPDEIKATLGPSRITVVYVNHLRRADGVGWSYPGYTCTWTNQNGAVILISAEHWVHTTLPHELGHALSPWDSYPWGHTMGVSGFDKSNLMWDGQDNSAPIARVAITLGQAFQLGSDKDALVKRRTGAGGVSCRAAASPCPRLDRDWRR